MKLNHIRISAISYINTIPFIYGIRHAGYLSAKSKSCSNKKSYSLTLDVPSVCAKNLLTNKTDIGIAPVVVIPRLKKYHIISDFCIAADGPIRTVMLYSEVPINNIRSIYLDYQSETSVMLVRLLAKNWWKISPDWIEAKKGYEKKIKGTTAGIIIGDRNFSLLRKYKFEYDLSSEWKMFTGFPFVFACWIANKDIDKDFVLSFCKSLKYGVANKEEAVKLMETRYDKKMLNDYLNNYVKYRMDKTKKNGMELFLKLCEELCENEK
ncbi:MAG: menaquinone biosynthesis protein [Bacteroidota bacterium]